MATTFAFIAMFALGVAVTAAGLQIFLIAWTNDSTTAIVGLTVLGGLLALGGVAIAWAPWSLA